MTGAGGSGLGATTASEAASGAGGASQLGGSGDTMGVSGVGGASATGAMGTTDTTTTAAGGAQSNAGMGTNTTATMGAGGGVTTGSVGSGGSGGTTQSGPTTIWIAGDSTVANGSTPCPVGWGKVFASYFDDRVTVVNNAKGGASVVDWLYSMTTNMVDGECVPQTNPDGSYVVQARWQQILDGMQSGDTLFIQFGINDGYATCDSHFHVGIEAFKEYYGTMAMAAKERGVQPIFVTPVSDISCDGNMARTGRRGSYPQATFDAGVQYDVPVIDLNPMSAELYTALGFCPLPNGASDVSASTPGDVGAFFCDDHTHFEASGATQIAGLIAKALKDQGVALAAYLAE